MVHGDDTEKSVCYGCAKKHQCGTICLIGGGWTWRQLWWSLSVVLMWQGDGGHCCWWTNTVITYEQ